LSNYFFAIQLLYPNLAAIAENIHTPPIPHPIAAYSPADKSENKMFMQNYYMTVI
jgi:hypothetical protein